MKLPKDILSGTYTRPNLFLCEVDKTKICQLETLEMKASLKFNAYSELSFTVSRTYTSMATGQTEINPFYDKIEGLRLLYLEGFGYFEIQDPEIVSDGVREVKNITAYSLEYTLSQKYLEGFNINTGDNNSLEVIYADGGAIIPITLYNMTNPKLSLLNLILEKVYGWSIGHVDASIQTMSRMFEISRVSIYDFIMQDICDKFNCFAVFDTINNTINLYAESLISKYIGDGTTQSFIISPPYDSIDTVSIDSYKTTAYLYDSETGTIIFDTPPVNGARIEITDGSQTQWKTDVYASFENLAQEVNISYSADDIKTVLTVKGANDLDIREVNMGLPYIVDLSYYYTIDWMGQELFDAYTLYLQKCNKSQSKYSTNSTNMLELTNRIVYEDQRLSLQYSIADHVSSTTVGTYYIRGGTYPNYYYTAVQLPDEYDADVEHYYTLSGNDLTEKKVSDLYASFQVYFMSQDSNDVSAINELNDDFAFMEVNTLQSLSDGLVNATTVAEKNMIIMNFLDEMWNQVGRNPLNSLYYNPYKTIEAANIEAGWNDESNENYWRYYPVTLILSSLEIEIAQREETINGYKNEYNALQNENNEIANSILIDNNFTETQLIRLSAFLREDEYTDDNFIETDSDTIESLMQTKQELLECGRIELSKLCEPKLEFSMDMSNIYAMPEFEPIVYQFQLGNLINVVMRSDYIKRARLLAVDINFDDFSDFTCEFGELTNLKTLSSIHADLLASALSAGKSVASNASYWNRGADVATELDLKIQNGLISAIGGLYNKDQSVKIDDMGILLRKVNDDGSFSPYQAWLRNNTILLSDDGFSETSVPSLGLGEFVVDGKTFYGILAKAILSGYIEGSTIVGGKINIGDGTFVVDESGHVTMKASSIDGYVTSGELSSIESNLSSRITVTENGMATKVSKDSIISSINQSAESIAIDANKISLTGKKIDLTSDNITINSTNFSVTKEGKIIANSGTIGGWDINPNSLTKVHNELGIGFCNGASDTNLIAVGIPVGADDDITTMSWGAAPFRVTKDGSIYATKGIIGGWKITSSYIDSTVSGSSKRLFLASASDSTDMWIGTFNSSGSLSFYVTKEGKLCAKNAEIEGKITASSGTIGGWEIESNILGNKFISEVADGNRVGIAPGINTTDYSINSANGLCFWAGAYWDSNSTDNHKVAISEAPYRVYADGTLHCSKAYIKGQVEATSGKIGGFSLNTYSLDCTKDGKRAIINSNSIGISGNVVFGVYDGSSWTAYIDGAGKLVATGAKISGEITATSGSIASACIPDLDASKITSGTISTSRLSSSVITTSNFSTKTLSTSYLTIKAGCVIGATTYNAEIDNRSGYVFISADSSSTSVGTTIYELVKSATAVSSNRDIKQEIHGFDDRYDAFFDKLNPQLFKYNFDLDEGYRMGYIWQEAEEARIASNLTRNDIGAIYESEAVNGGLGLQKTDFIALNTWQIQKLKARVEELEKKLATLEA